MEVCDSDSELMSVGLQVCGGEGGVGLLWRCGAAVVHHEDVGLGVVVVDAR